VDLPYEAGCDDMKVRKVEMVGIIIGIITLFIIGPGNVCALTLPAGFLIDAHNDSGVAPTFCNLYIINGATTINVDINNGDDIRLTSDLVLSVNNNICLNLDWTNCTVNIDYYTVNSTSDIENNGQLFCSVFRNNPIADTDVTTYTWYGLSPGNFTKVVYYIYLVALDPFNNIIASLSTSRTLTINTY